MQNYFKTIFHTLVAGRARGKYSKTTFAAGARAQVFKNYFRAHTGTLARAQNYFCVFASRRARVKNYLGARGSRRARAENYFTRAQSIARASKNYFSVRYKHACKVVFKLNPKVVCDHGDTTHPRAIVPQLW